jgi:hypothetical protein
MAQRLSEISEEEPTFGIPVDVYVYSDPVKRILAYALEEAERAGAGRIQARHLLFGLLVERECAAARLLQARGIDVVAVRSLP